MVNFFKRIIVRFLTRKTLLVAHKSTFEYFIVNGIASDGSIMLRTYSNSLLGVTYSQYKNLFIPAIDYSVTSVSRDVITLSSGESVRLVDINESALEEGMDVCF